MEESSILTWNVTNWITIVLMVSIAWWTYVGVRRLIVGRKNANG